MANLKMIVLSVVVLTALAAGCIGGSTADPVPPLQIDAYPRLYTPEMSWTPGIGLTPVYPAGVDNRTVDFRWQTDYGHFLSSGAPDYKINDLGTDVTAVDSGIFWSYTPDDMGIEKPTAHIRLEMIDRASGRTINTTTLDIGWKGKDYAQVISSP